MEEKAPAPRPFMPVRMSGLAKESFRVRLFSKPQKEQAARIPNTSKEIPQTDGSQVGRMEASEINNAGCWIAGRGVAISLNCIQKKQRCKMDRIYPLQKVFSERGG